VTFADLAQWWNLVFVLPFLTALLLLLLMTTGLIATEMGGDLDADVDSDIDSDTDVAAHGDVAHGDTAHGASGDTQSALSGVLDFFGVGKAPASVVLMSFCFIWGLAGVTANRIIQNVLPKPEAFIWLSMLFSLVCGIVLTHLTTRIIARVMPAGESYGVAPPQLIGKLATVRFRVTETSGTAQLTDGYGNFHEVPCRVKTGEAEFTQGERVVLMEYDEQRRVFLVRTDPLQEMGLDDSPVTHKRSEVIQNEALRNEVLRNEVTQRTTQKTTPKVTPKDAVDNRAEP